MGNFLRMTDSRRGGRAPDSSYSLVFRRFHGAAFLSLDGTEQSDLAPAFLRFSPVLCPVPSSAVTPVVAIRAATVRRTEAMRPGRLSSWPKAGGERATAGAYQLTRQASLQSCGPVLPGSR